MKSGLKVVCAWCKRVIQEGTGQITHGICPECLAQQRKELGHENRTQTLRVPQTSPIA